MQLTQIRPLPDAAAREDGLSHLLRFQLSKNQVFGRDFASRDWALRSGSTRPRKARIRGGQRHGAYDPCDNSENLPYCGWEERQMRLSQVRQLWDTAASRARL